MNIDKENYRDPIAFQGMSEPEVMRKFVNLSKMNFDRDSNFYPLGSCTMKYNPRINEKVARFEGFTHLHPMQDECDIQGALEVIYELQEWLAKLSGLPGVTVNPAAGAHGEFTGMRIIRAAHKFHERKKNVVLIPDSAHGTNPATATICGFEVKEVKSGEDGAVDMDSFRELLTDDVAAMMITHPNTCGLWEKDIKEIADLLHKNNSYMYFDGANFNALAGYVRPADLGADVMHFNLHKTFSTPHGGGGPGSGPVAVREDLRQFLPIPIIEKHGDYFKAIFEREYTIGRIKAFYGQFGMHVRALAYLEAMGMDGLRQATHDAILSANYIRVKLQDHYHMPFPGPCMHECLLTDKLQREQTGGKITATQIAKMLIDYGIHPPTVHFPFIKGKVEGALLIEPTESEPKEALDHFIESMIQIAQKIQAADDLGHLLQSPHSSPVGLVDEVLAARKPKLRD